jgi:hypothetical protein
MLKAIKVLEDKIRPMSTVNLYALLLEIDKNIEAERQVSKVLNNFGQMQVLNTVRTAIINVLDERDSLIFDNYCAAKYAA